jgi:hypothetical protein
VQVIVQHDARNRYWSEIHRDDGVVLLLPGFDRKWRVPHDLAHLATERALRITDGVFGSIAAGAMFGNMTVLSGRLRHDARQRSQRILRANEHGIGVSEILSGVVHRAVEHRFLRTVHTRAREAWDSRHEEPFPYQETDLHAAVEALDDLGRRYAQLAPGEPLTVDFHLPVSASKRPLTS